MSEQDVRNLIDHLIGRPECEFVEYKENYIRPEKLGELISALSNSAALSEEEYGYIIFGISDETHEVVGTTFSPKKEKIGNHELESWLHQRIHPRVHFTIHTCSYDEKPVIVFRIPSATERPVTFEHVEYVRVGSAVWRLRGQIGKEKDLWAKLQKTTFETNTAKGGLSSVEALDFLEYQKYFSLLHIQTPSEMEKFLETMSQNDVVNKYENKYSITNLGAILFAKNVTHFPSVRGRSVRVIRYRGNNNREVMREEEFFPGYAVIFEDAIQYINGQLPSGEEITGTVRRERKMYPDVAIREIFANALIHQDFSLPNGSGPMVEIFEDRVEITNAGVPLIETERFIDHSPITRNKDIASFMRKVGFCEERGSGIDRALTEMVRYQLPAPKFEKQTNITKVTLFAHKHLKDMTMDDRVRACYQHCVLRYVEKEKMTNTSLRNRLRIRDSNYPAVTEIINETMKRGLVKKDEKRGKYIPFWA